MRLSEAASLVHGVSQSKRNRKRRKGLTNPTLHPPASERRSEWKAIRFTNQSANEERISTQYIHPVGFQDLSAFAFRVLSSSCSYQSVGVVAYIAETDQARAHPTRNDAYHARTHTLNRLIQTHTYLLHSGMEQEDPEQGPVAAYAGDGLRRAFGHLSLRAQVGALMEEMLATVEVRVVF